ncbi:hypothetical protein BASA81_010777 [Batrachochytrium salamandrivorans]|nr:hypothetical protein BASA81_010777 [Batrachochytrium salamandrivorans]
MKYSTHLSKRKGEDVHSECEFVWNLASCTDQVSGMFFALLDGHGGVQTAEYANAHLLSHFLHELSELTTSACGQFPNSRTAFDEMHCLALSNAFKRVDSECQSKFERSGSTCTVVLVLKESFPNDGGEYRTFATVANVGDSHCYVAQSSQLIRVNEDHRAGANKHENARVEATEGWELSRKADPKGPLRLFPGGLMMTRSLGDSEAGACCLGEPSITRVCTSVARLVLASDGLWDALGTKEISKLALGKLDNDQCCKHLVQLASKREGKKFGDDVTVTVIDLGPFTNRTEPSTALWVWKAENSIPDAVKVLSAMRNGLGYVPIPRAELPSLGTEVLLDGQAEACHRIVQYDLGFELVQLSGTGKRWIGVDRLTKLPLPMEEQHPNTKSSHPVLPATAKPVAAQIIPQKMKKPDEAAHMFLCTGFPADWTMQAMKKLLEDMFKSRLSRCTLKINPDLPQERGFFFSLAKRVSFTKVCKTHKLPGEEEGEIVVARTRDVFPEFYPTLSPEEGEEKD